MNNKPRHTNYHDVTTSVACIPSDSYCGSLDWPQTAVLPLCKPHSEALPEDYSSTCICCESLSAIFDTKSAQAAIIWYDMFYAILQFKMATPSGQPLKRSRLTPAFSVTDSDAVSILYNAQEIYFGKSMSTKISEWFKIISKTQHPSRVHGCDTIINSCLPYGSWCCNLCQKNILRHVQCV